MRAFSWIMAGIGIGVGLTIMWMNEYREAETRLAADRTGGRTDEEWPLGKSFETGTKRRAERNLRSIADTNE
jgi:hypothetical protein